MRISGELQHVDVGRKNRNQEDNQAPSGEAPRCWNKQADPSSDFRNATQDHHQMGIGDPSGTNSFERVRHNEVRRPN